MIVKLPKLPDDVLAYFRTTGSQGGKARSKKLTAEQRSEIAKKGAAARTASLKKKAERAAKRKPKVPK